MEVHKSGCTTLSVLEPGGNFAAVPGFWCAPHATNMTNSLGSQHHPTCCCPLSLLCHTCGFCAAAKPLLQPPSELTALLEGEALFCWIPCPWEAAVTDVLCPADHQCCRNRSSHLPEAGEGTRVLGHRGRGGRCHPKVQQGLCGAATNPSSSTLQIPKCHTFCWIGV